MTELGIFFMVISIIGIIAIILYSWASRKGLFSKEKQDAK